MVKKNQKIEKKNRKPVKKRLKKGKIKKGKYLCKRNKETQLEIEIEKGRER